MNFDEPSPIPCDCVDANVYWVGIGGAKWYVHAPKSFHSCNFDFSTTKLLVFSIKPYGDMETFGEARVLGCLLVHGDLCEVQVLAGYRVRSFIGVENLFGSWECSP